MSNFFDAAEDYLRHEQASKALEYKPLHTKEMERQIKNSRRLASPVFIRACKLAGILPTRRQASKFNNGYGKAFAKRFEAEKELNHG